MAKSTATTVKNTAKPKAQTKAKAENKKGDKSTLSAVSSNDKGTENADAKATIASVSAPLNTSVPGDELKVEDGGDASKATGEALKPGVSFTINIEKLIDKLEIKKEETPGKDQHSGEHDIEDETTEVPGFPETYFDVYPKVNLFFVAGDGQVFLESQEKEAIEHHCKILGNKLPPAKYHRK